MVHCVLIVVRRALVQSIVQSEAVKLLDKSRISYLCCSLLTFLMSDCNLYFHQVSLISIRSIARPQGVLQQVHVITHLPSEHYFELCYHLIILVDIIVCSRVVPVKLLLL